MGDFLVYLFCLLGLDFFDELSRYSRPDGVGFYDRIREHQSICRHDSSFAHDGVIEHYGTHSYQSIIFDDGAVYHRIVPDRDEIAYMYLRLLIERVQHRTILNIDVITYDDLVSDDPALTLPHPRAHERAFVLVPWEQANPQAQLMVRTASGWANRAVAELAREVSAADSHANVNAVKLLRPMNFMPEEA